MCVYLYIHNKYTQNAHIYYVNKNIYFECNLTALYFHIEEYLQPIKTMK